MFGNLRFPKVFVLRSAGELITTNSVKPQDLTAGQVLVYNANTGVGTGATPTQATAPVIRIAQNLGDNKFGVIQSKRISAESVRAWRASKAVVGQVQTTYIGYNTTDGDLAAKVGQNIVIPITVYDRELTKFYGNTGFTVRIVPSSALSAGLNEGDAISQIALADDIIAQINGTGIYGGDGADFPVKNDLKAFVVASRVNSGAAYGVKIDTILPTIELLDLNDPTQFHKPYVRNFTVGATQGDVAFKVKTTQVAKPGTGYPVDIADAEKESQGYDRVRDAFEYKKHMKTNFIVRAQDGVKYDLYFIEFVEKHSNTGTPGETSDPYVVVFAMATGTGSGIEGVFNSWLTPLGFPTVNISSGSATGAADTEGA